MSGGLFGFGLGVSKAKELQKKTGKSFNECSDALWRADGDMNVALKLLKNDPEYNKKNRR